MATNFRPPRYRPQFQSYLSKLRRDYRLPEHVTPHTPTAPPEPAAPAAEPGAFEQALAAAGHLYELGGAPFRALAEDQYQKHMRAQSGWKPEMGTAPPTFRTPTGGEMLKAAAFDVGRPPATHGEAVLRGATEMVGEMTQDPVAMTLIGGGLGALPAGAARTAAHYGMLGMLGAGVAHGTKETYEQLQETGEWTPEVTETATRPAIDAALMLTPFAWRGIKRAREAVRTDKTPTPPPGPKASIPLDNDLAGWDLDSPRRVIPFKPTKTPYEGPAAERRGRLGTLELMTRVERRLKGLGHPGMDDAARAAERMELTKTLELVKQFGERMDATKGWPDPIAELRAVKDKGLVVHPRVAEEIESLAGAYETNMRVLSGDAPGVGDATLLGTTATIESSLLRLANRLGRNAVRSQRPTTPEGRAAQDSVAEALDVLWREIEVADLAGDFPKAEALRIRYKSLERAFMRGEGKETAATDFNARPGETVQEAASRLWAEIMFAEESGNVQWVESLRGRYEALAGAVARGQADAPAEAVLGPGAAPGPAPGPVPAPPPTGPRPVPAPVAPEGPLPGPTGHETPPTPTPAKPPAKLPAPAPTEGATALAPVPEPTVPVKAATRKAATKAAERLGPEAEGKVAELVTEARQAKASGKPTAPVFARALEDFDVYGLGPGELEDLRKAVDTEVQMTPDEVLFKRADDMKLTGEERVRFEKLRDGGMGQAEALDTIEAERAGKLELAETEVRVDLGRGPKGEGWVIQTYDAADNRQRVLGPYPTKAAAQGEMKPLQGAAKRNRAAARAGTLEEWEATIATTDPKEKGAKFVGPGGEGGFVEFDLDVQKDLAAGGKSGGLVRAVAAAHQMGKDLHEGWYDEFPWLKDLPVTGKRGKLTAEILSAQPRAGVVGPYSNLSPRQQLDLVVKGEKPAFLHDDVDAELDPLVKQAEAANLPYILAPTPERGYSSILVGKDEESLKKLAESLGDDAATGRALGYTEADIEAFEANQRDLEESGWKQIQNDIMAGKYKPGDELPDGTKYVGQDEAGNYIIEDPALGQTFDVPPEEEPGREPIETPPGEVTQEEWEAELEEAYLSDAAGAVAEKGLQSPGELAAVFDEEYDIQLEPDEAEHLYKKALENRPAYTDERVLAEIDREANYGQGSVDAFLRDAGFPVQQIDAGEKGISGADLAKQLEALIRRRRPAPPPLVTAPEPEPVEDEAPTLKTFSYRWSDAEGTRHTTEVEGLSRAEADDKFNAAHPEATDLAVEQTAERPSAPPEPLPEIPQLIIGNQVLTPSGHLGVLESIRHVEKARTGRDTIYQVWVPEQPGVEKARTEDFYRAEDLKQLGEALFFTSGMSRTKDLLTAALWEAPFGVDVGELSKEGVVQLGTAVARFRGRALVDSGAFSLFKRSLKQDNVEPLDFEAILDRYGQIMQAASREAGLYERDWHPPIRLVMPDVVGDQAASLDALKDHLDEVQAFIRHPFAEAIIPIQKGEHSLFEQLQRSTRVLSRDVRAFTIGLPGNAKAVSVQEVHDFVSDILEAYGETLGPLADMPLKFHFLGVGPGTRLTDLAEAVRSQDDRAIITSDANRVRSLLRGDTTRDGAVRGALGLPADADVSKPDVLEAPGPMPDELASMDEEQREGWIFMVEELLREKNVTDPEGLMAAVEEGLATSMSLAEATWHIRRFNAQEAPEPVAPPEPEPEPEPEPTEDAGAQSRLAAVLSADQMKAVEAAMKRISFNLAPQMYEALIRQQKSMERLRGTALDVDYLKGIGARRRTTEQKKKYTQLRAEAKALKTVVDAGWDDLAGVLKDEADRKKVLARLREILEKKRIGPRKGAAEATGLTVITDQSVPGLATMLQMPEELVVERVREYAPEIEIDGAQVLQVLEEDLAEVDVAGTAQRRAAAVKDREAAAKTVKSLQGIKDPTAEQKKDLEAANDRRLKMESQLRALDKHLKENFLGLPGYGGKRILEILTKGPDSKEFEKVVAYREQLAREMLAMQELSLEHSSQIEDRMPNFDEEVAELRSVGDALVEDLAEAPEPADQVAPLTGEREGEFPRPAEGQSPTSHLLKTFIWGVKAPGTQNSITTQEAIDAINQREGRIFARILMAYRDAVAAEAPIDDVPFDVPELTDDEKGKIGVLEASRSDRPLGGRYGPAPRRPTAKQAQFIRRPPSVVPPPRRRPDAREGGDAARVERPRPAGGTPSERPGRAGVSGERGPGDARDPKSAAARPKRGVFGVVLARTEATEEIPPDFSLIPEGHEKVLGEHQHLAVSKAIAQMNKGEGFLLADGTGVGKTHSIISVAEKYRQDGRPVLIVAPSKTLSIRKVNGVARPTGSYTDAAKQLGVEFIFAPSSFRPLKPEPGRIYVTTYHRQGDIDITPDTVVVFDEAHHLKNLKLSAKAKEGRELGDQAFSVLFATATPGDTADQFLWAERIGLLEGKTIPEQMHALGMHVTKKTTWKDGEPIVRYFWVPTSEGKTNRRIKELFERLTAKGAVLKREIDMTAVDVDVREVKLPPEAHAILERIQDAFPGVGMKKALMLQHQRRQQEPYKLAATQAAIQEELAAGRSVVVFAERINYSEAAKKIFDEHGELIGKDVIAKSEGTLRQLRAWLDDQAIPYSEIHGDAEESADEAINRFQRNEALVTIATIAKGGEGINLDDRTGERPRSMVMMTAPFSSVEMFQAAGRIHRYTTVSPSRIIMLKGDSPVDNWNFGINASKMQQLGARVSGQVELLRPDLLNEWNDNVNTADGELPEGELPFSVLDEALNKITNYQPSRDIRSNKHRNWTRAELSKLKPRWSEDGGVFTLVSTEGDVFHGYMVDGSFEIDKTKPETWAKVGFKHVGKKKRTVLLSPLRDKKGQSLIDGFAEATAETPVLTEGNLPGRMFTKEEEARRDRQRKGIQEPKEPKQKGLFETTHGHSVTNDELAGVLDRIFAIGMSLQKVKPATRSDLPWQTPWAAGKGRALSYEHPGGGKLLYSVLAERLHNLKYIDWTSGKYKVRNAMDVGAVAQLARNPVIEHSHLVAVKDGEIVDVRQTTSSLPVAVAWTSGEWSEFIKRTNDWITTIGADAVYGVHNHPSGNPRPSPADMELTRNAYNDVKNFKGSVVIDHEEFYTAVLEGKRWKVDQYRKSETVAPDPFLAEGMDAQEWYRTHRHEMDPINKKWGPTIAARDMMFRQRDDGTKDWPVLILRDPQLRIREVIAVPPDVFLDHELFKGYVKVWARMAGAADAVVALESPSVTMETMADMYIADDVLFDAVDVTGAKGHSYVYQFRQDHATEDPSKVPAFGGKWIDWEEELDDLTPVWRERAREDDRKFSLRPRGRRPARLGGNGGRGGGGDDGGDGPFDWPKALRPGPGESGWARAVRFAEMRMRRRMTQINMGVDGTVFWDSFIIGADRFAKGMRNFGNWMASVGEFRGFADVWRRVWKGLEGILKPSTQAASKRPKIPDADKVIGDYSPKPKIVRPVKEPTPKEVEKAIEAMIDPTAPDPLTGKPPVRDAKGDLVGTDININTVESAHGVHEITTRIVRALEAQFGKARSYRSWEQAKAIAIKNGYTEKDIRRLLQEKGSLTDYEIIAGRMLRQEATIDFSSKWAEYKDLVRRAADEADVQQKAAWETMAAEAQRDAKASLSKLMGIQYATVAAGSEAGRALAIHRMLVKELTPKERLMWQIMKDRKYGSDDQLQSIAEALEANDMGRVGDIVNRIYKPSHLSKLLEWWLNAILSGPPTQAANITGNTTMQAIHVPETAIASRLEHYGVRQALERWSTGEAMPRERELGEAWRAMQTLTKMKFGVWDSLKLSWDAIWSPDKYAFGAKGEYRPPAIGGLIGKIVRSPSRWMEGADLGAKMSAAATERSKVTWRMAVQEARKEGGWDYQKTLRRANELETVVDEYAAIEVRRKLDPKSLTKEERMFLVKNKWAGPVVRRMEHQSDVMTFRDETMDITKYVTLIRSRYPWLTFMVPFIKTPERIFVQALRRTPMGLAKTLNNIRTGKLKGGEASDRMAQGILGTMMSASVYMLARDGQITGSGPADPRRRRDWLATGKRPYAVKVPMPDGARWVSFARIEPLATTFGFAADLAEAQDDRVAGDAWDKLHYSMIQNITNKTFLEGMISTAEAVGDPDRYGARFYKRMVGGLVPNLLATAARAIDPTIRSTDTIGDTLLARVPWFSTTVAPRLSGTGELIDRGENALSRFISPFRYAKEAGPEKNLERMFIETGYSPSNPPRSMTLPGTMGRKVMLTESERQLYAAYARRATQFARGLTSNGDWSRVDVYFKAEILRRIYRYAHDAGRKAVYRRVLQRMRAGQFELKER